jgi:hypothetical protein
MHSTKSTLPSGRVLRIFSRLSRLTFDAGHLLTRGTVVDEGPGGIESHGRVPLSEGGPRFVVGIEEFGVGGVPLAQSPSQVAVVEDAGADTVALEAVTELAGDGGLASGGQSGHDDVEKGLFHPLFLLLHKDVDNRGMLKLGCMAH